MSESKETPRPGVRPLADWSEAEGAVLWWRFPVEEPPWVGEPTDSEWPGYHTHFTRLPPVSWDERLPPDERGAEVGQLHIDALIARAEAAERERDALIDSAYDTVFPKMQARVDQEKARADAAEKKLEALVEAAEGVLKYREAGSLIGAWGTLLDVLRAARGKP